MPINPEVRARLDKSFERLEDKGLTLPAGVTEVDAAKVANYLRRQLNVGRKEISLDETIADGRPLREVLRGITLYTA